MKGRPRGRPRERSFRFQLSSRTNVHTSRRLLTCRLYCIALHPHAVHRTRLPANKMLERLVAEVTAGLCGRRAHWIVCSHSISAVAALASVRAGMGEKGTRPGENANAHAARTARSTPLARAAGKTLARVQQEETATAAPTAALSTGACPVHRLPLPRQTRTLVVAARATRQGA